MACQAAARAAVCKAEGPALLHCEAEGVEPGDAVGWEGAFAEEIALGVPPGPEEFVAVRRHGEAGVPVGFHEGTEVGVAAFPQLREVPAAFDVPDEAKGVEARAPVRAQLGAPVGGAVAHDPFPEEGIFLPTGADGAMAEALLEGGELLEHALPQLVPLRVPRAGEALGVVPLEADGIQAGDALGAERAFAAELALDQPPVPEDFVAGRLFRDAGVAGEVLEGEQLAKALLPQVLEVIASASPQLPVKTELVQPGDAVRAHALALADDALTNDPVAEVGILRPSAADAAMAEALFVLDELLEHLLPKVLPLRVPGAGKAVGLIPLEPDGIEPGDALGFQDALAPPLALDVPPMPEDFVAGSDFGHAGVAVHFLEGDELPDSAIPSGRRAAPRERFSRRSPK